jgi:2-polyprenyl-3-methyl-5-hydroxy-6-metoxy-1,4-benzoquinol methylase
MTAGTWNPAEYDKAWTEMAANGKDPHGEVAFIQRLLFRHLEVGSSTELTVLDAGCGTGRVAIELDHRGFTVEGTDIDEDMLGEAASKAPHLQWTKSNLADLDYGKVFDLIVLAGNVILFVDPEDQPRIATALGRHAKPGTLVVAGMQLTREDGRFVAVSQWDEWMTAAGFLLIERFSTWDDGEWNPTADYVVSVHRTPR